MNRQRLHVAPAHPPSTEAERQAMATLLEHLDTFLGSGPGTVAWESLADVVDARDTLRAVQDGERRGMQ